MVIKNARLRCGLKRAFRFEQKIRRSLEQGFQYAAVQSGSSSRRTRMQLGLHSYYVTLGHHADAAPGSNLLLFFLTGNWKMEIFSTATTHGIKHNKFNNLSRHLVTRMELKRE